MRWQMRSCCFLWGHQTASHAPFSGSAGCSKSEAAGREDHGKVSSWHRRTPGGIHSVSTISLHRKGTAERPRLPAPPLLRRQPVRMRLYSPLGWKGRRCP
jgi:hypothetical protein